VFSAPAVSSDASAALLAGMRSVSGITVVLAVAIAGLSGLISLAGWAADVDALKSIVPDLSTMKANTAVCFVLCAVALDLSAFGRTTRNIETGRALAFAAAVIGLITLVEYALGADLGFDTLLFSATDEGGRTVPGRMSPPTAFGFLAFGIAMALPRRLSQAGGAAFIAACHLGVIAPVLAGLGYLYGMKFLYAPTAYSSMAIHTAISFIALFIGMTAMRRDIGWAGLLRADGATGTLARRMLPSVVILPLVLGWLILWGEHQNLYRAPSAVALLAGSSIILLTWIVWTTVRRVRALDAERHRQEVLNRVVLETAFDGFVLMDRDGRVVEWNPQAEKIFGWTRSEALGRDASDLMIAPPLRPMFQKGLAGHLATGEGPMLHRRSEVRAVRRDGDEFPADLIVTPISRGDEVMFSGFVRDVSEQKRTEEQLRQAQKMEAVGQLTGGIAHDFNNLLTVIVGRLDLAIEKVEGPLRDSLEQALKAADRGANLVRQLLTVSRRQTLAPSTIDINELADGVKDLLSRSLGEHVELTVRLGTDVWPAFADKGQVENALLNLAINARDAMPNGGKLVVETGNVILDAAYCSRNEEVSPGPYVMLAVTDTGIGMPPEVIQRAFEPFFTTKEVGKGTGLGLSMVYGFAKQSRGHLKIYSEVGHGTTVRLYLPRHVAEGPAAAAAQHQAPVADAHGDERILVVEDDVGVRTYVVAMLRDLGYGVLSVANGPEAIQVLESAETIDLMFTDLIMPGGMTGRDLAAAAIRLRPGLRTLFTSGYSRDTVDKNQGFGSDEHFLSKPYRRADVAQKLREVLGAAPTRPAPRGRF
jgi:PAS domain S-box-containing protein